MAADSDWHSDQPAYLGSNPMDDLPNFDIARITGIMAAATYLERKRRERWRNERPWWLAIGFALALLGVTLLRNGQ